MTMGLRTSSDFILKKKTPTGSLITGNAHIHADRMIDHIHVSFWTKLKEDNKSAAWIN